MSDLKDHFDDYKKFQKKISEKNKSNSIKSLLEILKDNANFKYKELSEYHYSIIRISDNYRIDFYPKTNKYHIIKTGERGIIDPAKLLSLFNNEESFK